MIKFVCEINFTYSISTHFSGMSCGTVNSVDFLCTRCILSFMLFSTATSHAISYIVLDISHAVTERAFASTANKLEKKMENCSFIV